MNLRICTICGGPIQRVTGEHESFYAKRNSCSIECRNIARSRAQKARLNDRLIAAMASWRPGQPVSRVAQASCVRSTDLRAALRAAGREIPPVERKRRARKLPKGAAVDGPPVDFLLEALLRVYGPRVLPTRRLAA